MKSLTRSLLVTVVFLGALSARAQIFFPIGPVLDVEKPATMPMKESTDAAKLGTTSAANTVKQTSATVQDTQQRKALQAQKDADAPATSYKPQSTDDVRQPDMQNIHTLVDKQTGTTKSLIENDPKNISAMMDALTASQAATDQIRQENENARTKVQVQKTQLTTTGVLSQEMLQWNAARSQKTAAKAIRIAREQQQMDTLRKVRYAGAVQ